MTHSHKKHEEEKKAHHHAEAERKVEREEQAWEKSSRLHPVWFLAAGLVLMGIILFGWVMGWGF
jgi:hypothetical protein